MSAFEKFNIHIFSSGVKIPRNKFALASGLPRKNFSCNRKCVGVIKWNATMDYEGQKASPKMQLKLTRWVYPRCVSTQKAKPLANIYKTNTARAVSRVDISRDPLRSYVVPVILWVWGHRCSSFPRSL